jgi:cytochrome c-type protein NapC
MEILKRPIILLAILGVVTISVIVLFLPIYFAVQPSYCRSCHAMQDYYDSWRNSSHAKQDCIECHTRPGYIDTVIFAIKIYSPVYAFHQTKPGDVQKPENATCLRCHNADRVISPSGIVKIPHKFHIREQKMKCVDCHEYLVHYPNPEGRNTPSMDNCMKSCHNGKKADNACLSCHPKKATPASHSESDWKDIHPARFKQLPLVCTRCHSNCNRCHKIRPESHNMKWKHSAHGKEAETLTSKVCGTCHKKDYCETCHLKHPLNWKDIHYSTVLRKTHKSCTECHDTGEFCIKCHTNINQ